MPHPVVDSLPNRRSVLDRKLFRDLFAAKGVLAAIMGIIAVGICCFVAMASAYWNLQQSRDSYYVQCRMADFWVDVKKAPDSVLNELDIAGISEVEPRIQFQVRVDLDDLDKPLSGQVLSLPDIRRPVINDIVLKRGSYFTEGRRQEVIVNDGFARARNIHPGQRIDLILNNRREVLYVIGTAISSEFVYLLPPGGIIPDPQSYGVFYVKHSYAEEVFDFDGAFNQLVGLLSPSFKDTPDVVLQQLETKLTPYGVFSTMPRKQQASNWFLSQEIDGLRVTVAILPTLFLSVAAIILNVLMTRMAEQQRTVIGTLKAIGYSERTLFVHYLKFGTAVGLIGGILGVVSGYWMASGLMSIYRQFYEFPRLVNEPYPSILVAGIAISVGFAVAGSLRGVRTVVRLNPAEAMRPKPPVRGGRIALERLGWFWSRLDFRWQLVLRGIARNRMRTVAGGFAAAVGAALILVSFYSRDAMNEMVDYQFEKVLRSDFDLVLEDQTDYSAVFEAEHLPYVELVEPVFMVACTFRNGHVEHKGAISGLSQHSTLTVPLDADGNRASIPPTGLLLTRKLAEVLDTSVGDALIVEPVQGLREPRTVRVAAIVDSYLGLAAYADFGYLNRLVDEVATVNMLQLKVAPGTNHDRDFYRGVRDIPAIQTVNAIRGQKQKLVDVLVEQMRIMLVFVIGFAGIIFFGSILNASLISLAERQREIATLRAIGYRPGEIGAIFLRESLCINLAGTLVGFPLGYWLSLGMSQLQDTELFRVPMIIHPASWALTFVLGLCFTLLAHIPVQWAINRMDWLSALNVRE